MRTRCLRFPLALGLTLSLVWAGACDQKKEPAPAPTEPAAKTTAAPKAQATRQVREPIRPALPVAAPPEDAVTTESGLAYKILTPGTGDATPGRNDTVQIHYTSWKTTGETLFSTRYRDRHQRRYLPQQAPGWVETLTAMKVGEKRMVWMPPELAYAGRGPKPTETSVYEVELLDIKPAPPVPDNVAAAPEGAKRTKSGVAYEIVRPGSGDPPRVWDMVSTHMTSWTADGKMLQSTKTRDRPQRVDILRSMPGWREVLETMSVGQVTRAWIPAALSPPRSGVSKDDVVVYEFELVEIERRPDPPPVPADVAGPPKGAKKTKKGVSYVTLTKGKGNKSPAPGSIVSVHYAGWTTDGTLFDASHVRGQPVSFALDRVIPGWTDGMSSMVEGERRRLWIPEELAYKGKPNAPQGMLVFDVELLEITERPAMRQNPWADGTHGAPSGHGGGAKPAGGTSAPKARGAAGQTPKAGKAEGAAAATPKAGGQN
ncbi:FKBP-type peptidyl-prolyl cis-trans isomerase [Haliangium sp.]|uniref:FKBP-type peptidyl-prolyl cis-trans isomerase n=1 Tax=Haliangium sp. TaxID=2663208 RepID=UPI003D12832B